MATQVSLNSGAVSSAGSLKLQTNGTTDAVTLDASGNLGLGTTSPSAKLTVNDSNGIPIRFGDISSAPASQTAAYVGVSTSALSGLNGDLVLAPRTSDAASILFYTGNGTSTERARIDSSGNLLVGATSLIGSEKLSVQTSVGTSYSNMYLYSSNASYTGSFAAFKINSATGGGYEFLRMFTSTQEVLRISGNGNIANLNNSYTAISDIKLKENIVDATPKLAELMQVRIVNYNLKENPELKQIGVVAQELEQIFPALIDELRDTDAEGNDLGTTTKSVKYSVFVPMLIKAIQEQQAIITQLQADVAALKGQA